jgi:hypothetical protein
MHGFQLTFAFAGRSSRPNGQLSGLASNKVDAIFAPPAPARHGRQRTDSLTALCCCTKIKNDPLQDHNRPLTWVGDTGIEPVTSSV